MTRLCACGCGQPITGQRSKKFYSDACRKRFVRSARPHNAPQTSPLARETRTRTKPAMGTPVVRESDTNPTEINCPCGRPLPRIYGPLPENAYCKECVQDRRCPCYNRPAWQHRKGA